MISRVNHHSLTRPLGHPVLFLPFKSEDAENTAITQILEVQAVDPPASRSWFMDDDIILEDGRLLLMTPIDPAFLLLPVLRSIAPVGAGSPPRTQLTQLQQVDGTFNFRTLDDIFSLAAIKLSGGSHDAGAKSTEPLIQEADVLVLSTLDCIPSALSRLCEMKGLLYLVLRSCLTLMEQNWTEM
jgi:ribonuclease H2 subunit B